MSCQAPRDSENWIPTQVLGSACPCCCVLLPSLCFVFLIGEQKSRDDAGNIFSEGLQDLTVHEGEPATFTAILKLSQDALQSSHAQWYFEEEPINESDVYKMSSTSGGIHSLLLPEAFPEDAGKYTLEIQYLEHGEKCYEESSAHLSVQGTCVCVVCEFSLPVHCSGSLFLFPS